MIAPIRIMLLSLVLVKSKNFLTRTNFTWAIFLLALSYYSIRYSDNFLLSFLGHPEIGGGLIDFILISLLPISLPVRGFKLGVILLAIILIFHNTEHAQELANAFLAPAAFIFSPLESILLLISAIITRSRSAIAVIAFAIIIRSRSRLFKIVIAMIAISVIAFECYQRYHYLSDSTFWDAISTNRLWQWRNLPSSPMGINSAITTINTLKFHNAFIDFRVISGDWILGLLWLVLIICIYNYLPLKILLSFLFIQFFWYNSIIILFGWFFLMNSKNKFPQTTLDELLHQNPNDDGIIIFRFFTQKYSDYQYIDNVGFDFQESDFSDRPYFEIEAFYPLSSEYIDRQIAKYPKYKKLIRQALGQLIPDIALCPKCYGEGCSKCNYDGLIDRNLVCIY